MLKTCESVSNRVKSFESFPRLDSGSSKSLKHFQSIIRTKCLNFFGIVQSIAHANPSGMTEQDKLNMAITTWETEEKEKGGFKLLHCYNVLKNSPKWSTEVTNPTDTRSIPASGSIDIEGDGTSFGHMELERPIGRKAEMENRKKRKMKVDEDAESQKDPFYASLMT
ncbi:hypothetical protein AKJ16_DCAP13034 [Drosera capensis]